MGLTQAEYEALDSAGQDAACERAARVLREAGAADVVRNLSELPGAARAVGRIFALAPLGLHGQRKSRLIRVVAAV